MKAPMLVLLLSGCAGLIEDERPGLPVSLLASVDPPIAGAPRLILCRATEIRGDEEVPLSLFVGGEVADDGTFTVPLTSAPQGDEVLLQCESADGRQAALVSVTDGESWVTPNLDLESTVEADVYRMANRHGEWRREHSAVRLRWLVTPGLVHGAIASADYGAAVSLLSAGVTAALDVWYAAAPMLSDDVELLAAEQRIEEVVRERGGLRPVDLPRLVPERFEAVGRAVAQPFDDAADIAEPPLDRRLRQAARRLRALSAPEGA